ncbi:MAG: MMPL family transporter [Methanobacteriota archaeon]|nr:MAG: MMPL family transporter [Euryarchaeota archaeon]
MAQINKRNLAFPARHPLVVIFLWLLIVGIVVSTNAPQLLNSQIENERDFGEPTSESGIGSNLIQERFQLNETGTTHILVINNPSANFSDAKWSNWLLYFTQYLNDTFYNHSMTYYSIVSYPLLVLAGAGDFASSLISEDGHTTLINIQASNKSADEVLDDVEVIRESLHDEDAISSYIDSKLARLSFPIELASETEIAANEYYLTGEAAQFVDITHNSEKAFRESEVVSVILAIIILALVFKSPMGVAIPMVALLGSLYGAYFGSYLLSLGGIITVSDFLPSIIAMIGIAVAVDYNLFSIIRFREEYRKRKATLESSSNWNKGTMMDAQKESASVMVRTSGQAVTYSGIAVIIGFLALATVNSSLTRSMAFGVSIVVILSILTAVTLTPAILAKWGRFLDWPDFLSGQKREITRIKKMRAGQKIRKGFWESWSRLVMKLPVSFLVLSLLILAPFISLSLQADLSFDSIQNLPKGSESREGLEFIVEKFDLGTLTPYQVVIDTGKTNGVFNSELFNRTIEFARWAMELEHKRQLNHHTLNFLTFDTLNVQTNPETGDLVTMSLEKVQQILASPDFFLVPVPPNNTLQPVPNYQKLFFIQNTGKFVNYNNGNDTLVMDLTSNLDFGSGDALELASILRDKAHEMFDDLDSVKAVYVTGASASLYDSRKELFDDVPLMLTFAVIALFIALLVLFRSIILPIKAIVTIAGSILFGIGTLVFVFQEGNFVDLLGAEPAGITFFIPIFLFTTILGLGMDYSIFIISRIKEETEKLQKEGGHSQQEINVQSVSIGLSKTAGVITSAATVMIATFAVFALSPILILKTMGLAMAVAIFIDATVSRVMILPAAMRLAGKWNWWIPKWLDKILPKIELDH